MKNKNYLPPQFIALDVRLDELFCASAAVTDFSDYDLVEYSQE